MTDDLIARLRSVDVSWSETGEWCAEAADRIEELTTEARENARIIGMSAEREMALRGEVERLRNAMVVMDNTVHQYADLIETQAREIERLREALQMAADDCQFCRGNGSYLGFRPDTGENLWDDCPDCKPFRTALEGTSHE